MNLLKKLFHKSAIKREIDEELRSHIEQRTAENLAKGMSPEDAARDARKRFGNLQSIREESRGVRGISFGEATWRDIRFGLRMLRKNPGFTAVAVLTLALGIGANTAIFTVVDRLLVRPLPVANPQQLVLLGQSRGTGPADFDFNYPLFRDYQRANTVFSQLTAIGEQSIGLGIDDVTEPQRAELVSGNYFTMLGVNAALGRTFATDEGVELDDAPVVVLSHQLWRRRFAADPQVIGRTVKVNGQPFTVVGVAPREFTGTTRGVTPDLYVPITMYRKLNPSEAPGGEHPLTTRYFTWHSIMGRLKADVAPTQAQLAMNLLAQQVQAVTPANTSTNLLVLPGAQGFTSGLQEARLPLNLLLVTAGLVLLIACANLANLQLARATGRTRDFAIRLALGAGRIRLIRELLTESLMLALGGGLLGVLVAVWLLGALEHFRPPTASVEIFAGLDQRVLLFTFGISVLTGIIFGLAPAWRASRPQIIPELKGGGSMIATRMGHWNLRNFLVVGQVALSLLILVSAGLCVRSLRKLQNIDGGFDSSQVVLMSFNLGLNAYSNSRAADFYDRLLERVRTLPGVEAASLASATPLNGSRAGMSLERIEDYQHEGRGGPSGDLNAVSPDYFRALGVRLLLGRDFNTTDSAGSLATVVVNDAFAQRYWPGQPAVGKRIFQHGGRPTEVVGVVASTRNRQLSDSPRPTMYFPITQMPGLGLTLVVRTGLATATTVTRLREVVKDLDANVPVFGVRPLAEQRDASLALQRMAATMLGGFSLLALALAALGIYGVLAYSVGRRTREIGVRMALGAQVDDVLALVLRQGLSLVIIGTVLGLTGALMATRLLKSFLYEIKPLDPLTFGGVVILLALVAFVACWLPARRAAKVDPMVALRHE